MGTDRRTLLACCLVGGGLAGLALPPLGAPPLLWLALLPLWMAAASDQPLAGGASGAGRPCW
ncbi:hypothetical protein [Synechococcus sp. GFB01]|uniref:hypothetical protein n=1 Tax=Synechococcus sp. GFB01 TaxID=1662190 RepID=UPI000B20235E|nr:hypothetical protein [Synechococcus sp. GFB01]